jgi:hypothetical protein
MIVKKHLLDDNSLMLAICDEGLIGKNIEDKKQQLDLSSEFYKGKIKNKKEIGMLIKEARIINVVGEKSIKFLQEKGLIEKISFIKKIPYAQITHL